MNSSSASNSGPEPVRQGIQFEILSGLISLGLITFFALACWYYSRKSVDYEWIYVAVILALPLLQVPVVILMLKRNSDFGRNGVLVLVPSLGLEVALWWAFNLRNGFKEVLPYTAFFGLGWSLVLGAIVFYVTGLIMGFMDGKGKELRTVLRDHPFLVVCFFLTVFTFIALFLSLSLALHDQDLRLNHEAFGLFAKDLKASAQSVVKENDKAPNVPFTLLFRQGSAAVEFIEPAELQFPDQEDDHEPPAAPEDRRKIHNAKQLNKLIDAILQATQKDRVRVVLAGHSDDLPMDSRNASYKSNFELSEARIHHVIVSLLDQLGQSPQREWKRNLEWLALPCANEQSFLRQSPGSPGGRNAGDGLSVEVLLLPAEGDRFSSTNQPDGRDLDLLDYLYFGIYTITTTGYGDIIPVSPYAKFITTVANFFEVFLMVVFFNVLLSFLREGGDVAKGGT